MSRAAIRYAKALLSFSSDAKQAAAVNADMKQIRFSIAGSSDLKEFLSSPIIKIEQKKSAVEAIFANVQAETTKLFQLLQENKRFELLYEIAVQFNHAYDEIEGVEVAYVTTAIALSGELEQLVLSKIATFSSKKITIENSVNPDIIGGFILRIGDMQYNASVANKLQELKREFSK